jgi:hypothetical protein
MHAFPHGREMVGFTACACPWGIRLLQGKDWTIMTSTPRRSAISVTQMAVGMGTDEAAQSVECNRQKPSRSNSTQVYSKSNSSQVYRVLAGARHVFVRLQTCS